jgi:tetratricopeptide (TPR) repeat protein
LWKDCADKPTMGNLTAFLLERFRAWERPAQTGFLLALALFFPALIVAAAGPESLRWPATIGAMGLVIVAQVIFMWANRGMVTPFTRAQRHYLNGEFAAARDLLQALREDGKADVRALTLLGNTYRQLGQLEDSEAVLSEAVDIRPNHYFPLYGFGRTLLVQGRYSAAVETIQRALDNGAEAIVYFDAAEAHYRQGEAEPARALLQQAQPHVQHEPHRALMTAYLLYRLDAGERPAAALIREGLAYWQNQAALFAHTPYGQAVAEDISGLQALIEEV